MTDRKGPQAGFTLIELLVVVALIVLITVFALPNISNFFKVSLNSTTLNLASTIKEAYNASVVSGDVYRIVLDLKEQTFWAEKGPEDLLLESESSKEKTERRNRFKFSSEDDPKNRQRSKFELAAQVTPKKITLPKGVRFKDVTTEQDLEPISEGKAYGHFFPNGISEQLMIRLEDNSEHKTTLFVESLSGRSEIMDGHRSPKDVFKR